MIIEESGCSIKVSLVYLIKDLNSKNNNQHIFRINNLITSLNSLSTSIDKPSHL